MAKRRFGYLGFAFVAAGCMLAGCGAPGAGVAETMTPGVPKGLVVEPLSEGPAVTWIVRGETFAIVTWGSGSCPLIATALFSDWPDRIAVSFGPSPNDPCTADMAPTTHEFELPSEVTRTPVTIDVTYEDWPETDTLTLE